MGNGKWIKVRASFPRSPLDWVKVVSVSLLVLNNDKTLQRWNSASIWNPFNDAYMLTGAYKLTRRQNKRINPEE